LWYADIHVDTLDAFVTEMIVHTTEGWTGAEFPLWISSSSRPTAVPPWHPAEARFCMRSRAQKPGGMPHGMPYLFDRLGQGLGLPHVRRLIAVSLTGAPRTGVYRCVVDFAQRVGFCSAWWKSRKAFVFISGRLE
jgi:hypothetical protein